VFVSSSEIEASMVLQRLASIVLSALLVPVAIAVDPDDPMRPYFGESSTTAQKLPLPVTGTLPSWLRGEYIISGPGKQTRGKQTVQNYLDGYAKMNLFSIDGRQNSVDFSAQFLNSKFYDDATGHIPASVLLRSTKPKRLSDRFPLLNIAGPNDNCYIVPWMLNATTAVTLTDTSHVLQFDLDETGKVNSFVWQDKIGHKGRLLVSSAAHIMRQDMDDLAGDTYGVLAEQKPAPQIKGSEYITLYRIQAQEPDMRIAVASIPVKVAPYVHSFGLSEDWAVIVAQPASLSLARLMSASPLIDAMEIGWNSSTTIHLVSLANGTTHNFTTDFFLFGHVVNCWQPDGDTVIMDIGVQTLGFFTALYDLDVLWNSTARDRQPTGSQIRRYTMHISAGTVSMAELTPMKKQGLIELPKFNERLRTRKHCFVYFWETHFKSASFADQALVKLNVCTGGQSVLEAAYHMPGSYPSEPYFVHRPNATDEDDGVLLTIVWDSTDAKNPRSSLVVLDARTMAPVASMNVPFPVPSLIHGLWHGAGPS